MNDYLIVESNLLISEMALNTSSQGKQQSPQSKVFGGQLGTHSTE
jgi:hypothetical protein